VQASSDEGVLMINVRYDPEVDAAYIELTPTEPGSVARCFVCPPDEVGATINLDFDKEG